MDNLMQEMQKDLIRKFSSNHEIVLSDVLMKNGFDPTDFSYLKENFEIVIQGGWNNLMYKQSRRIISWQTDPEIVYEGNKVTATYKYY